MTVPCHSPWTPQALAPITQGLWVLGVWPWCLIWTFAPGSDPQLWLCLPCCLEPGLGSTWAWPGPCHARRCACLGRCRAGPWFPSCARVPVDSVARGRCERGQGSLGLLPGAGTQLGKYLGLDSWGLGLSCSAGLGLHRCWGDSEPEGQGPWPSELLARVGLAEWLLAKWSLASLSLFPEVEGSCSGHVMAWSG